MKHVEIDGKEIAIANINGKYYAFDDRCGHSSARLSMGVINGNVVTCSFHGAQFDCTTGKRSEKQMQQHHQREVFLMSGRKTWNMPITSCLISGHTTKKHTML
jgi:nitrite reductase/ring-hydroxylating ferredoxin subunit